MAEPPVTAMPFGPRRGAAGRSSTWWGRAWLRTFEEIAFDHQDLASGRRIARSGRLGAIAVEPGLAAAVVTTPEGDTVLVRVLVETLSAQQWSDFAGEVARAAGHAADLLAGQLTPELVEHADELGVEVLPGPEAVSGACGCDAWAQPCRHVLGLMYQLTWLIDADPFLLFALRGCPRERLLALVSDEVDGGSGSMPPPTGDLGSDMADAADRAEQILRLAENAPGTGRGLADSAVAAYDAEVARLLRANDGIDPGKNG